MSKGPLNMLSKESRQTLIKEIITYFKESRDEEIGVIAAEEVLDFFVEGMGKDLYNKGIEDSKASVKNCMENLEVDLDLLFK